MDALNDLKPLRTFMAVIQQGSFVQAAHQLHVVPSVVAKRIAQLEASLGTRLFERTTRKVQLTAAGERLRAKTAPLLASVQDLVSDIAGAHEEPYRHLRVMAPTTLTTLHLGALFARFLQSHPRLTMEVALGDRSVNPVEESFDLVISGRLASYEDVLQYPLAPIRYVLCAAPSYLRQASPVAHPTELADHPCLVFEPLGRHWVFQSPRGTVHVEVQARLLADDNQSVLHATLCGLGVAMLPGYIAQPWMARGRLRPLLQDFPVQDAWFKAYVPKRRADQPHVATLRTWLEGEMGRLLAG